MSVTSATVSCILRLLRAMQALKGTQAKDRYELYWSPRPEFVRAAARFDATIVPIGAVGAEENASAVLSAEGLKAVGERFSGGSRAGGSRSNSQNGAGGTGRRARRGVNDVGDELPPDEIIPVRRFMP
jgi:hypothetical protein